jgi:hypothetical protein
MTKKIAKEIVKNLTQTIDKMTCHSSSIEHKNEVFELPRAKKTELLKIKNKYIKKYNIKI